MSLKNLDTKKISPMIKIYVTATGLPISSKEFLDIQANIECGFTLKCERDMTRTYSHKDLHPSNSRS